MPSSIPSSSAVTLERYADLRKQVRARHASLTKKTDTKSLPLDSISKSNLWSKYNTSSQAKPNSVNDENQSDQNDVEDHLRSKLGPNYILEEETVRNDYSQQFLDSRCGDLPASYVHNPSLEGRFQEYPRLRKLVELQNHLVESCAHPPTYLNANLLHSIQGPQSRHDPSHVVNGHANDQFHLSHFLPVKYDVILIDPPLECYEWEGTPMASSLEPATDPQTSNQSETRFWSWEQVSSLPIPHLAAKESFVFLWVGSGAGNSLERGREALAKWGYRRCEDICWVATDDENTKGKRDFGWNLHSSTSSGLSRTVQHCLMGIRGTVKRSTDTNFVHCNIDTDVILAPPAGGPDRITAKPAELHHLIENFCLGTRRIELFGTNRNLRRGWLTVGTEVGPDHLGWAEFKKQGGSAVAYDKAVYDTFFLVDPLGCTLEDRRNVVPFSAEADALRPKSPQPSRDKVIPGAIPNHDRASLPNSHFAGRNFAHHTLPQPPYFSAMMPAQPQGNGLSGLGAGGRQTVSIPSGSETLSGPQASVLGLKGAPTRSGPSGLGRSNNH